MTANKYAAFLLFLIIQSLHLAASDNITTPQEKQSLSDADQTDVIAWKSECHQIKMAQPMSMVEVYVINDKNELLLGKYEGLDLWSTPMTWMQKADEGFKKCGQRAVLQETGITVDNFQQDSISDSGLFGIVKNNELQQPERTIIVFYTARHVSGDPQVILHQNRTWLHCYKNYESWQWFSTDNLPAHIDSICLTHEELAEIFK
jgi:ADP-ribose pyrophosphatase YjhB (NUDIX family)